jgi:hypothetical protein
MYLAGSSSASSTSATFRRNGQRVLELRPNCECCDRDLDPASPDVFICTYECTWCRDCVEKVLRGVCPNCGGELVRRPVRPAHLLVVNPPSIWRVLRRDCAPAPTGPAELGK